MVVQSILRSFLLLLGVLNIKGSSICFGTPGTSHLKVHTPILQEALHRGHNISVFLPTNELEKAIAEIGQPNLLLNYLTYEVDFTLGVPDIPMSILSSSSRGIKILQSALSYFIVAGFGIQTRNAFSNELVKKLVSSCDIILADMFLFFYGDLGAKYNIPVIFISHVASPLFVQPPFALLPFTGPYLSECSSQSFLVELWGWVFPFLSTTVCYLCGFRAYGYPRHFLSAMFARPLFVLDSFVSSTAMIPRNVLFLGPLLGDSISSADLKLDSNQPRNSSLSVTETERHRERRIDVTEMLGCGSTSKIRLVVRKHRLIVGIFGTQVRLLSSTVQQLCQAFSLVLDAGAADAVLFSRQPLYFTDTASVKESCQSEMIYCNDTRIWTTDRVSQQDLFNTETVGVFLSHGGFASMKESRIARLPTALYPVFAEQPMTGDVHQSMRGGYVFDILHTPQYIAKKLVHMQLHRQDYISQRDLVERLGAIGAGVTAPITASDTPNQPQMSGYTAQQKAVELIELAVEGGANNVLQRLVSPVWTHYASVEGPSVFSYSFSGAMLWTVCMLAMLRYFFLFVRRSVNVLIACMQRFITFGKRSKKIIKLK
mmetsp:Transcript_23575/g.23769  ORF Transcript_23575/g.23769 Transcript_23575/m.23769 type:complete len:599 (+) Transcript_23575:177-1973(+)